MAIPQYEFSYTTIATGERTTFTIPDASYDAAYAALAISEEVARAIRAGLRRVATIENVSVTRVSDTRIVNRDAITPDPGP